MRYLDPNSFIKRRFADHPKPEWRAAVICFRDLESSGVMVSRLRAVPVTYGVLSGMSFTGDIPNVHEADINGHKVGIVSGCFWGGPQAAVIAEELGCIGVEYILGFGAAGSISRELPKCTQIAALKSLTTDGTSRAYTRSDVLQADPALIDVFHRIKTGLKHEVVPVTTATIDAIYQETDEAVQYWSSLGAQAINMETSPLYAASAYYGVKSLWLGFVSDCLHGDDWDSWHGLPVSLNQNLAETTANFLEVLLSNSNAAR